MRSSDIAARCREIALRVQCSGEWGELAETLTQAATEVERLKAENATLRSGVELLSAEATTLRSEVERLRLENDRLKKELKFLSAN